MVVEPQSLDGLNETQLRAMLHSVLQAAAAKDQALAFKQVVIDKLTHENALLKRMKFAAQTERYSADQKSLLEDDIETDLAAVAEELNQHRAPARSEEKQSPKRQPLPAHLPRREIRHEPESRTCQCGCQLKRIGEDVAEKLDYVPGVFTVERHIRGKWACARCETIIQAPVAAHVIDKGIPTTGLLAQVLVAKYADHLPLYRQEAIFGRAGLAIPRSTATKAWKSKIAILPTWAPGMPAGGGVLTRGWGRPRVGAVISVTVSQKPSGSPPGGFVVLALGVRRLGHDGALRSTGAPCRSQATPWAASQSASTTVARNSVQKPIVSTGLPQPSAASTLPAARDTSPACAIRGAVRPRSHTPSPPASRNEGGAQIPSR